LTTKIKKQTNETLAPNSVLTNQHQVRE